MLYGYRRHLKMSVAEVRVLPWWERRLLDEGLINEFSDGEADEVVDATGENLSDMGFSVGTV